MVKITVKKLKILNFSRITQHTVNNNYDRIAYTSVVLIVNVYSTNNNLIVLPTFVDKQI